MSDEDADHYFLGEKKIKFNVDLANLQQVCGAALEAHLSISTN